MTGGAFVLLAAILVQPIANEDILEPSIQNEVDHALALVPDSYPPFKGIAEVQVIETPRFFFWKQISVKTNVLYDVFSTNGLKKADIAIKIVSQQKNGRWFYFAPLEELEITDEAVRILRSL